MRRAGEDDAFAAGNRSGDACASRPWRRSRSRPLTGDIRSDHRHDAVLCQRRRKNVLARRRKNVLRAGWQLVRPGSRARDRDRFARGDAPCARLGWPARASLESTPPPRGMPAVGRVEVDPHGPTAKCQGGDSVSPGIAAGRDED